MRRQGEPERRAAFRKYTEQAVRQGTVERPWDRLVAGLVLGTEAFARSLSREVRGNRREQLAVRKLAARADWAQIVSAVQYLKGETWDQFAQRHGDWGRDAALWLGRKRGGLSLAELGKLAGRRLEKCPRPGPTTHDVVNSTRAFHPQLAWHHALHESSSRRCQ
ncbi:MAG TPA: hypothetical protein VG146_06495 [Verrucomicrobiae bacterium]|nr:hypothetical protein [Verrucomicrobiae bacterium]